MSEPDMSSVGTTMQWLSALVTTLLGFIGVRLHNKVDKLQDVAVSRAELKEIQEQNRLDRTALHGENLSRLERIEGKIDIQAALVQRMAQVESELGRLRDWKHDIVDPYLPGEFNAIKAQLNRIEDRAFNDGNSPKRRRTDV